MTSIISRLMVKIREIIEFEAQELDQLNKLMDYKSEPDTADSETLIRLALKGML